MVTGPPVLLCGLHGEPSPVWWLAGPSTGSPHPLSGDSGDCPQQGGHWAPEPSLPSDLTCRWAWTGQLHPGPQQQSARSWALEDPTQWRAALGLPGHRLGAPPMRHPQQEHPSWGLTVTGGGTAGMAVSCCTWQVQHRHHLRGHHARTCHSSISRSTATPSSLGLGLCLAAGASCAQHVSPGSAGARLSGWKGS